LLNGLGTWARTEIQKTGIACICRSIRYIPGLKKGLRTFRVCRTLKWTKMSQSTYVQTPKPAEICVMFVLYLQQMLCLVPMHVNRVFSSSSHRSAYS
jgi:hypothetical protein